MEDRFGVLDLAGLTDRTIGRTHVEHPDAFSDYIRKRAPDFVWLHGSWVPRFGVVEEEWFRAGYLLCSAETYLERAYGTLYIKAGLGELSDCRQIGVSTIPGQQSYDLLPEIGDLFAVTTSISELGMAG